MKVVCAWCNKVITEGEGDVSHGICNDCLKIELQKLNELENTDEKSKVPGMQTS